MKKSFIISLILVLFIPQWGWSQRDKSEDDSNPSPGVDFIIGGGIYFGSKKTAGYYSGQPQNENNLNYIFDNYSWKKDIVKLITDNNNFISSTDTTIGIKEYPTAVKYKPAMSVMLGASYRFNKHWRLSIYYTFARLTAKDIFTVSYTNLVPGNERNDYLQYLLIGKENRSFIDVTGSYTFDASQYIKPFIEFGAQLNFVKVKSFDAVIENREFNLLDVYGGSNYVAGTYMQEFEPNYGGAGFAFTGTAGVKFCFNENISIDPIFYISWGKIHLTDYNDFHFNYGAYVRLIMSDGLFKK